MILGGVRFLMSEIPLEGSLRRAEGLCDSQFQEGGVVDRVGCSMMLRQGLGKCETAFVICVP